MNNIKQILINKFPSFYEEGMSTYEILRKIVHYLNQCVDGVNTVNDKLYEFIHWFENLGVQDEINQKLEEMEDDGSLAKIINEQIFEELNNKITNIETTTVAEVNKIKSEVLTFPIRSGETNVVNIRYPYGNVHRYGAVGDGVADDSLAINYAVKNNDGILLEKDKKYRITKSIVVDRHNYIQGNNSLILADFSNWTGDTVVIDFKITDPIAVEGVLKNWSRETSGLVIQGVGSANVKGIGIKAKTTIAIEDKFAMNYSLYAHTFKDIYIRDMDTGILLVEAWGCNFDQIYGRNLRTFLEVKGKSVNNIFSQLQAGNFTRSYTSETGDCVGILINESNHYTSGNGRPEGLLFSDSVIYGGNVGIRVESILHCRFNNFIVDGCENHAIIFGGGNVDDLLYDNCYLMSSGYSVVRYDDTITPDSKCDVINSRIVGGANTVIGMNIPDNTTVRSGITIENNVFTNLAYAMSFNVVPQMSRIVNNKGYGIVNNFIWLNKDGYGTVIDNNFCSNNMPVILLGGSVTSQEIDIRNNRSYNSRTYRRSYAYLEAGQTSVALPNGLFTEECGFDVMTVISPKGDIGSYYIIEESNWSDATLYVTKAPTTKTRIDFISRVYPKS